MGRWIIVTGIVIVIIGLIVQFAPWVFNWFGKLPGDINLNTERTRVFIPLTSMVISSIVLTILVNSVKYLVSYLSKK